jgi:hypothetical protein
VEDNETLDHLLSVVDGASNVGRPSRFSNPVSGYRQKNPEDIPALAAAFDKGKARQHLRNSREPVGVNLSFTILDIKSNAYQVAVAPKQAGSQSRSCFTEAELPHAQPTYSPG